MFRSGNASLFRRHEREMDAMLRATMPKAAARTEPLAVVAGAILPPSFLTGRKCWAKRLFDMLEARYDSEQEREAKMWLDATDGEYDHDPMGRIEDYI